MYLSSICLTGIMFSFIRSNIFTGSNLTQFNPSRCLIGSIFWYILTGVNYMILNITFLHRVSVSFKGSAFAYKPWIYRVSFVCILWTFIPMIIIIINILRHSSFIIHYDPNTNIGFCAPNWKIDAHTY